MLCLQLCGGGPSLSLWHLRSLSPTSVFPLRGCQRQAAFHQDMVTLASSHSVGQGAALLTSRDLCADPGHRRGPVRVPLPAGRRHQSGDSVHTKEPQLAAAQFQQHGAQGEWAEALPSHDPR